MTSRFAAPYERSLSVTMRFGMRPCFLSSLISNRLAAFGDDYFELGRPGIWLKIDCEKPPSTQRS